MLLWYKDETTLHHQLLLHIFSRFWIKQVTIWHIIPFKSLSIWVIIISVSYIISTYWQHVYMINEDTICMILFDLIWKSMNSDGWSKMIWSKLQWSGHYGFANIANILWCFKLPFTPLAWEVTWNMPNCLPMYFCLKYHQRRGKILYLLTTEPKVGMSDKEHQYTFAYRFNTLRPRQNGRHFTDNSFKCIFVNENATIAVKISLTFVPKGPINNIPALVEKMAWRRPGDKPLSEPMMVSLPTHICVTRPQWVNTTKFHTCGNGYQEAAWLGNYVDS